MEDYEAQELEFWRKLDEDGHEPLADAQAERRRSDRASRSSSSPGTGLGAGARHPRRAAAQGQSGFSMSELVAQAKKEGKPQHDRAAARLGELRRDHVDVPEEVRHQDHERQPGRQLRRGEPGRQSLKGDSRAPDAVDDGPAFAISGTAQGLFAKYYVTEFATIPRAMKDTRGYWTGDYWGAISIGYNANLVNPAAEDVEGPAQPGVQGQGRAQRQPAHVGLGGRRRLRRGARERRLAQQRRPGHRLLRQAEEVGQLHPGAVDAADGRVGPDADLDRLGLPEPRLREGVPGGELEGRRSRPTASTARTTARRSTRRARIRGRRACGRSSSTPTRASCSG